MVCVKGGVLWLANWGMTNKHIFFDYDPRGITTSVYDYHIHIY